MDKNQTTNLLRLSRAGLFANALVWLALGLLSASLAAQTGTGTRWIYSVLMLANAAVMAWFGTQIMSGQRSLFFLAIVYMAVNVALTITDQIGIVDALILFLNLALLGLLFVTRLRLNQAEG